MLKPILMVGLFLICSFIGAKKSYSLKKRKINLTDTREIIERIGAEIKFSQKNIYEIIKSGDSKNQLFNIAGPYGIQQQYLKVKSEKGGVLSYDREDWRILDGFFESLGKSDVDGQTLLCQKTVELLKRQEDKAEKEYLKRAKMYSTTGVLAGLFFIIILL